MPVARCYGLVVILWLICSMSVAAACDGCCGGMSGIQYCDSSVGRYVCSNGEYSSCYCTRHAVMDLQKFEGCCLWGGGVLAVGPTGVVICNDGRVSEICSLRPSKKPVASF